MGEGLAGRTTCAAGAAELTCCVLDVSLALALYQHLGGLSLLVQGAQVRRYHIYASINCGGGVPRGNQRTLRPAVTAAVTRVGESHGIRMAYRGGMEGTVSTESKLQVMGSPLLP